MRRALAAQIPAKLEVGPKFLPHVLYGPYWVVAAGGPGPVDAGGPDYDYAIISGVSSYLRLRVPLAPHPGVLQSSRVALRHPGNFQL